MVLEVKRDYLTRKRVLFLKLTARRSVNSSEFNLQSSTHQNSEIDAPASGKYNFRTAISRCSETQISTVEVPVKTITRVFAGGCVCAVGMN